MVVEGGREGRKERKEEGEREKVRKGGKERKRLFKTDIPYIKLPGPIAQPSILLCYSKP